MKTITSLALQAFVSNLLVGCVVGDNLTPVPDFPKSCAEIATGDEDAKDGEYKLFVDADATKPWKAYCDDMRGAATEYLTLPDGGDLNWSTFLDAAGNEVRTRFDKVRIDPVTLKIDISDQTFAMSTGSLTHNGTTVTSMPFGVAMSCGGGYASAQINVIRTPFVFVDKFDVGGATGASGNANPWSTNQVVEMWADGNCAWIAPTAAPANPMNDAGDFLIELTYQPQP